MKNNTETKFNREYLNIGSMTNKANSKKKFSILFFFTFSRSGRTKIRNRVFALEVPYIQYITRTLSREKKRIEGASS